MMKKMINALRKYLYISLGFHIFVVLVLLIISSKGSIKQPFVVFGAHSKKDYHTIYKSKKSIIPFMGQGSAKFKSNKAGNRRDKTGSENRKSGKSTKSSSGKSKRLRETTKNLKITEKSKRNKLNVKKSKASDRSKQSSKQSVVESKNGTFKKKVATKVACNKRLTITEPANKKNLKKNKKEKQKELEQEKKIEAELKKIELEAQKEMDEEIKNEEKRAAERQKKIDEEIKEKERREAEKIKELEEMEAKKEQESQSIKDVRQAADIPEDFDEGQEDQADDNVGAVEETSGDQNGDAQEEYIFTLGDLGESQAVYNRHIQAEIGRLWKPALWVPKGTTCKVKFVIGKDGEVKSFQTIQKSNVIIYDLSILRVAHLFKFDKCLWGKSFVVDFRQ